VKYFYLTVLFIVLALSCSAQGTVRGKVTDNLGETVIGATIVFKSDPSKGVTTDFDGNYSIDIPTSDPTTLIFSFIGFKSVELTVNPKDGEIIVRNVDFVPKDFKLGEVVIEAKANKAGDYYMEKVKKNSATSIDYISNETMRKVGDSQISAAIQRVSGVSSVSGFVTVRGLADKYVLSSVNGLNIPTLDPFTNNINLDIFPSRLVDNLVITKTGSPELQGDWSGAFISLETKDFPDEFFVNFSASVGVNSNAHFGDEAVSSNPSNTDWLGYDNGYRDIPDGVPVSQENFPRPRNYPGPIYDEYVYLGLEDYLNSFGITSETNITAGNAYSQLGLIELGYLGPGDFGNTAAVNEALANYNEDYGAEFFFPAFNSELAEIGQSFNNDWFVVRRSPPINMRYNFSIGDQTKLFGKQIGYIAGFQYSRFTESSAEGRIARTSQGDDFDPDAPRLPDDFLASVDLASEWTRETANLSFLTGLSLKVNENNSISFMFMPNFLGENNARFSEGFDDERSEIVVRDDQFYSERRHLIYQMRTQHFMPGSGSKLNLDLSYTDGQRNEPDFRLLDYNFNEDSARYEFENTERPLRSYREMDDDILHAKLDYEIPIDKELRSLGKMQFGGSFLNNTRENLQTNYQVQGLGFQVIDDRETVINEDRFGINPGQTAFDLNYQNVATELDNDVGFKNIYSVYAMADYNFYTWLRVSGGLRVEYTDILTDIKSYYERDLPSGHPDRRNISQRQANPIQIYQTDFLPSVNLIFKLRPDEQYPSNLRVNYFRSLARPSFRELSPINREDFILQGAVSGNPNLEITKVNNYDLRWENFYKGNHSLSVSLFYKTFTNHIELFQPFARFFTWENADNSYVAGLEIEGQYAILENLTLKGNITFIYSQTEIDQETIQITREMYGQAPYLVNGILSHEWRKFGLTSTISYNVQGPKLALVTSSPNVPDIYEIPIHRIDLKLGKSLGDHFRLSFSIRNLLNQTTERAYNFDRGFDILPFDNFNWGTNYRLTLSYSL